MKLSKIIIAHLFGRKKKCKNFDFTKISSILIRPFGFALGDSLIHLSFASQLKSIYPELRLGILVNGTSDLFSTSQLFDELVSCTFQSYIKNRNKWQLLLDFRETFNTPDLIADKIISPRATMIFSKQDKPYFNKTNITNYDFYCPWDPNSHVINHLQTSLFTKYFTLPFIIPELTIGQNNIKSILPLWGKNNANILKILLAPQGNMQMNKHIPVNELADLLNRSLPISSKINLLVGYTQNSQGYFSALRAQTRQDIHLTLSPQTSLKEYLALVASADIVIGIDSGTVHLACALKKPLLSFYAPHNINTWHPLSHPNVPHLMIVAPNENTCSTTTKNFPIKSAEIWLKEQINQSILHYPYK